MNAHASASVNLSEPDVEGTVLGSILAYPDAIIALCERLRPEWFADPAARMFFEAALRLHRDGHKVSGATVIAAVSPDVECDGLTRAGFVAECARLALPLSMLSGSIACLKDRWARRLIASEASQMTRDAVAIDVDPVESATTTLAALDQIIEAKGEQVRGSLAQSAQGLLERLSEPADDELVTTGLRALDGHLNGYPPAKLFVVAARPGMGKSALMCSSARRTAKAGHGVACFSLEMDADEIAARCIADTIGPRGPTYGAIMRRQFSAADMDPIMRAREGFDALPFHMDASARLSMPEIASRCRSIKAKFEAMGKRLSVVFIDHAGLVEPSDRYRGNKVAETGEVSRAAKILAKELRCCVVLLCQLSREVEKRDDKRPTLSDLRWSGDIEQDADAVGFLYRPEYYLAMNPQAAPDQLADAENRLEFLIRKNRNGPVCDVPLWCSIGHSAIRDGVMQ